MSVPVVNFNGAFLVESLEVGSIIHQSTRVFAVRVLIQQTLSYPVLARGRLAAEIYAYCFDAHQNNRSRLEAYVPCRLFQQPEQRVPVIENVTWYISTALRERSAAQVAAVLKGDVLGDGVYPRFRGEPFARFTTNFFE